MRKRTTYRPVSAPPPGCEAIGPRRNAHHQSIPDNPPDLPGIGRLEPPWDHAGSEGRQCGFDLTFSTPKCGSALWARSTPGVRKQLEEAHQRAMNAALEYLLESAGVTRRGKQGQAPSR